MFHYENYYNALFEFTIIEKAIQRKNASKNEDIVKKRTKEIIAAYNKIIIIAKPTFQGKSDNDKREAKTKLIYLRDRLIGNLAILNRTDINVPKDLTEEVIFKTSKEERGEPNKGDNNLQDNNKKTTMATEKFTYLSNISKIITSKYDGDPNELNAFINSIELADSTSPIENQSALVKYIKTKLTGTALEAIPENVQTAKDIIESLKRKIHPETSKVIIGRFLALRADKHNLEKFADKTEDLSNALRRAYISEGINQQLAEKMTIEKTVDMCRLSAKSNLVKSILASTTFSEPKEVVAKLITESTTETNEATIFKYNATYNNNSYRGRGFQNNQNRNRQFNNRYRYNNRYNNSNHTNGSYSGNAYNNNRRGGFRGRRGRKPFNQNNWRQPNNDRYVRNITSENDEAPSSHRGQEQEDQNVTIREFSR